MSRLRWSGHPRTGAAAVCWEVTPALLTLARSRFCHGPGGWTARWRVAQLQASAALLRVLALAAPRADLELEPVSAQAQQRRGALSVPRQHQGHGPTAGAVVASSALEQPDRGCCSAPTLALARCELRLTAARQRRTSPRPSLCPCRRRPTWLTEIPTSSAAHLERVCTTAGAAGPERRSHESPPWFIQRSLKNLEPASSPRDVWIYQAPIISAGWIRAVIYSQGVLASTSPYCRVRPL